MALSAIDRIKKLREAQRGNNQNYLRCGTHRIRITRASRGVSQTSRKDYWALEGTIESSVGAQGDAAHPVGEAVSVVKTDSGKFQYYEIEKKEVQAALMGMSVPELNDLLDSLIAAHLEGEAQNLLDQMDAVLPEGKDAVSSVVGRVIPVTIGHYKNKNDKDVYPVRWSPIED